MANHNAFHYEGKVGEVFKIMDGINGKKIVVVYWPKLGLTSFWFEEQLRDATDAAPPVAVLRTNALTDGSRTYDVLIGDCPNRHEINCESAHDAIYLTGILQRAGWVVQQ